MQQMEGMRRRDLFAILWTSRAAILNLRLVTSFPGVNRLVGLGAGVTRGWGLGGGGVGRVYSRRGKIVHATFEREGEEVGGRWF